MANLSLGFCIFVLLFVGSLIDVTDAEIHVYDNKRFTKIANGLYVPGGSEALYASKFQKVDAASSPGTHLKGISFIRFDDITFVRTKEAASKQKSKLGTSGLVETVVFEIKDHERIGGSLFKSDAVCCTSELADAGSCNLGEVIIRRDSSEPDWPKRISTFFEGDKEEVKMSPEALVIKESGLYTVYFMTCDQDLDGTVVKGRSVWKNPDGYLPGEKAPFKSFYACMFWAYALLALFWFPGFVQHWNHRIQLHSHITLVIVLAMCESALRYYEFTGLNSTGISPLDVTCWAITFSSLKMSMSRLLLLVITTGYGVVKKPIVGNIALRMHLLGVVYFVLAEANKLAEHLETLSTNGLTFIMLLWAVVENCVIQWTFRSLWNTLKKLKVKKNMAKLHLYEMFATALVILTLLNIALIYVKMYYTQGEFRQVEWIITASWYILAYVLLLLICLFWAPSDKLARYLYIAEMEDEFEEEEGASLTKNGEDGDGERRTVVDAFIIFFGNLPRGKEA